MFYCSIGSETYAEIFQSCFKFEVLDSPELPNRICNTCETHLINFNSFCEQIKDVEERLRAYQSQFDVNLDQEDDRIEDFVSEENEIKFEGNDDDESYLVEQIYEEEESQENFENNPDEDEKECHEAEASNEPKDVIIKSSPCRFIPSEINSKLLKCLVCDSCELETLINEEKPEVEIPIVCECEKVLKNRRSYLKHYSLIHQKKTGSYVCRICSETFTSWRSRGSHEAKEHEVGLKFQCSNCEKKFFRSDHLKEHDKTCNKSELHEKFFSCSICLFTFQREETYKKHLATAHVGADVGDTKFVRKAEEYAQKYSKRRLDETEVSEEQPPPTCTICDKVFKNAMSLSRHKSLFHSNQVWSCEKCDAVFIHRSTRNGHMAKEHGMKKPYECTVAECDFACFKRDRYKAHMEKHENPEKKFPCPICQQEFNSYNTMTLHRSKHLTKQTFVCIHCNKQFLDKRNFNVHMRLHTGEDLFYCPICDQWFNRKDHLQKHQLRKNHYRTE